MNVRSRVGRLDRGVTWSAAYLFITRVSAVGAVPLVLNGLGQDLFAVWVLASTLVMAQGLIDFGFSAALIRFVGIAGARGSRKGVTSAVAYAGCVYGALSLVVAVPIWIAADRVVAFLPYLDGAEQETAATLARYAGAVFVMVNFTFLLASALQGLGRVDAAFRSQTLGWLVYLPALALTLDLGWGIHAVGLAWVLAAGLQISVLAASVLRALRALARTDELTTSIREMAGVGARWQVSSWADFATFQLPRLVTGIAFSSDAVVAIDLAIRFSQIVVSPLFAFLPVVLPRATRAWARAGEEGLRNALQAVYVRSTLLLGLGTATAIPLAAPAIAVWTARPLGMIDPYVTTFVIVGVAAHASTGVLSSAFLAVGRLRLVVVYKYQQFLIAVVLLLTASTIGVRAVAVCVCASLALPAAIFNRRACAGLSLFPLHSVLPYLRLCAAFAMCTLASGVAVLATSRLYDPWAVLAAGGLTGGAGFLVALAWLRAYCERKG
jgi:O-antigen/teichoic acid export membrane protein